MADLLKLKQVEEFRKEYFHRNRQAEENRQKETQAAIRIQSWFRACKPSAKESNHHTEDMAGFAARARVRQMVKAAYFTLKMNFYNEMAVRIQQRWKGFYVRKYIHNFYARKTYLEQILIKNELVRKELNEIGEAQKRENEHLEAVKEQKTKIYQAHQLHYLISTNQHPGVFNSPYRQTPHEMELLLRQVKYQVPVSLAHKDTGYPRGIRDSVGVSFSRSLESQGPISTRTWDLRTRLPPIASRNTRQKTKRLTDEADN